MNRAIEQGYQCCLRCTRLWPREATACKLCGKPLHSRTPKSIQATTAHLITAILCYFPANFLPIMQTTQLGQVKDSTILGGVIVLWELGAYPTAAVIFAASVMIPIAKIFALGWLCWSARFGSPQPAEPQTRLYRTIETIGSWSMIDVFVVAMLVALVQFGGLLTIAPGPAALAFCGMVVFTMFAAHAFDSRLLWDRIEP